MFQTYAFVPNIVNPWWTVGSSVDLVFTKSLYFDSSVGSTAVTNLLSISRASIGYAKTSAGTLTQFSNDTLRITDLGLLVEDSRTNVVLWCRDLTNAAWTQTNITAAKDQTGPDGITNSASSIVATAGNGTILQSITLATADRFQSAWVKRITGTGTINMTMDNGSTWTAITTTPSWAQVTIPTQTIANPTVGFQIVTSGDKIAVDFVQNENGTFASSPIPTTTTSAARAADNITAAGDLDTTLKGANLSVLMDVITQGQIMVSNARLMAATASGSWIPLYTSGSTGIAIASYLNGIEIAPINFGSGSFQTGAKCAFAISGTGRSVVGNAGTVATDANTQQATVTTCIGSVDGASLSINSYLRRLIVWNSRLSDTTLQALTAP